MRIDGQPVTPTYLDSLSYQASTRGSRWVDGFLKGKAVFKDSAPALGWVLIASGDVAHAVRGPEDSGAVGTALQIAGVDAPGLLDAINATLRDIPQQPDRAACADDRDGEPAR